MSATTGHEGPLQADTREHATDASLPELGHELPLLVLPEHAVFPGETRRFDVQSSEARALVESLRDEARAFVVLALERGTDAGSIAILARVMKSMGHASGNHGLVVGGLERVRLAATARRGAFRTTRIERSVERVHESPQSARERAESFARLQKLVKSIIQYMPELPTEADALVDSVPDPGRLADLAGANLDLALEDRAALLAATDVDERLALAIAAVTRKLDEVSRESAAAKTRELRGLWPFEPGADERLRSSVAGGSMTREEAARVADFVEKGYTVWERLISPADVAALLADVERIREHPGHFVTTDHRNSMPYRYSGRDFDAYESIFDLYVNFESSRRVCFHPTILRFLELLFDARPVAFQQLLFQRSNGHPLHQDTAYVCVDQPLHLVATWIALEDVVQGRGELTYYEGSHRIPHFFFRDGSKRFHGDHDEPGPVSRHIAEQIAALGCKKRDFLAKKGDVFLWSADLVHGSNPRTRPEVETRRSCVTHYCPETTRPFWFRVFKGQRGIQEYGSRARIASSYYKLPKGPEIVRPAFLLPECPPGWG